MNESYLGDSYDLVKRFLCQILEPIAKLYAHECFVPIGIRKKYTQVTTLPFLGTERPKSRFGVLLDPDTGITLGRLTPRHTSLEAIIDLNQKLRPEYIICFDQSHHRQHKLDRDGQRTRKMNILQKNELSSFYYKSHAPFLFTAQHERTLRRILECLVSAGIPKNLLQQS